MVLYHKPLLAYYWQNREIIKGYVPSILLLVSVINGFDYALLAFSVRYIDVSVAAVLFEMWPIFFVLLRAKLEKQHLAFSTFILLFPAITGLAFVIFSQSESNLGLQGLSADILLGGILAFGGGLASACTAFSFKWALNLQKEMPPPSFQIDNSAKVAVSLVPVLIAFVATNLISFPITIAIGLATGERVSFDTSGITLLGIGLLGGAFVQALGSKLYRISNVVSDSLGVNAIYYFSPCFTLLWLFLIGLTLNLFGGWQPKVSGINVTYIDLLIIGTTLIISSNLLINFNAEIRLGFKALLIALGSLRGNHILEGKHF